MPIEHAPWLPTNPEGFSGQKVAIVGYSHHRNASRPDFDGFTRQVIQDVVEGRLKGDAFFTPVRKYFGFEDKADFWNRVMFFNFLPECIGVSEQKYARGTQEQTGRAKERVLKLMREYRPDKVFVFTRKGWTDFPLSDQERGPKGKPCAPLIEGQAEPSWGEYRFGDHRVLACGFRHPQFATNEKLTSQVKRFLALKA